MDALDATMPSISLVVGTHTYSKTGIANALYHVAFDPETTAIIVSPFVFYASPAPAFVLMGSVNSRGQTNVYAVNETSPGSVSSFLLDDSSIPPTMTFPAAPSDANGVDPCFLSLDRSGRVLFVCNYSSGNVVMYRVSDDGALLSSPSDCLDFNPFYLSRPVPAERIFSRQESPHPHSCYVTPCNNFILVADLGLSSVFLYSFDAAAAVFGALVAEVPLSPNDGARTLACIPVSLTKIHVYVSCELTCRVSFLVLCISPSPSLSLHSSTPCLAAASPSPSHHRGMGDLRVHPRQSMLYVSLRGGDPHGHIALLSRSLDSGELQFVRRVSSGGGIPRSLLITNCGGFMVVCNQAEGQVRAFRLKDEDGDVDEESGVVLLDVKKFADRGCVGLPTHIFQC